MSTEKRKLTRAERKQIEAAIARANQTDKKQLSAQDSIPYQRMFPDGICRVTDTFYTKTVQYQDINYQLSQNEDKTAIFEGWCDFLNYFDSSIRFQLSFLNLTASRDSYANSINIPPQGDEFDSIRAEYTEMLQNQLAKGNNGLIKTKYLTFGIEAASLKAAKPRLERIETDVINNFKRLGVVVEPLNGKERLRVLHQIFHMDGQEPFQFSWDWLAPSGLSTKDFIAPSSFSFPNGKTFCMGKKFGAVSFVQILAPELNDRMLADFLDMESSLIVNLHIQSVDQVSAIKTIKRKILRGLYVKEQDGFFQDPEGFADRHIPPLEGTPSYQVGDQVTLPAPDHPITGTIDAIEDTTVRIYTGPYAWSYDVISREQFEIWLRQDERNAGLFTQDARETPAPEITSEPVTVYPGDKNGLPYDVVVERLHIDEPEPAPSAEQADHQGNTDQPRRTGQNFRITDDHLGEGGPRLKYQANITAIRLLKELEAAGQQASPEQQEVLSRYVGWGGVPEVFDPSKTAWAKEYAELKELLTPEEYEAARASTLNAHYTSPMVIRAIYEAVEQMGFHSGNILEPSCGVGNFFGMLPESMGESKLYGVELDSITGRIARQLYPNARIEVNGFEKTQYPDGVFDLAIGNVPFGNYRVSDRPYDRHNLLIHDYFFAKTIDKVRAGGIIAFITSNGISGGTMDKKDAHAREYMARRCDLLGAVRLPNTTFRANAGTDIAMDIVFLQKREVPRMQGEPLPEWVETDLLRTNTYTDKDGRERHDHVTMNRYFRTHPEMVLGDLDIVTGPFGPQLVCNPREGADLEQQLHEAIRCWPGTTAGRNGSAPSSARPRRTCGMPC